MSGLNRNLKNQYSCDVYRQEMILIGLRRQLHDNALSEAERKDLMEKISELESEIKIR